MIEEIAKIKPKKDVFYIAIIIEVLFEKWFPLEGVESHEKNK